MVNEITDYVEEINKKFQIDYKNARLKIIRELNSTDYTPYEFMSESDMVYYYRKELEKRIRNEYYINSEVSLTNGVLYFEGKTKDFNKKRKEGRKVCGAKDERKYIVVDLGIFSKKGKKCIALLEFTYKTIRINEQPLFGEMKDNVNNKLCKLRREREQLNIAINTGLTKEGYIIFLDELVYEFRNEPEVQEAVKSDKHIQVSILGTDFKEREHAKQT